MPKLATARPRGPVSAENLRRLVRNSPLPVMLMQIETLRIVEVSDAFVAVTGRDRASLLAATAPELTEQPETATKSMALVASGIIDGYTRRATFRRPSGELLDRDVHITACTESDRQHAVVSVLPANWSADRSVPRHLARHPLSGTRRGPHQLSHTRPASARAARRVVRATPGSAR